MSRLVRCFEGRPMAEHAFSVRYDGPAIDSGRIPVRDLAPALLALGDLFVDASVLTRPQQKPVGLSIEATSEGSFIVHLVLEAETAWDHVEELFASSGATALVNLWTLVVGTGTGLFAVIRKVKNKRITSQETVAPGRIRLTLEDGETFEVPAEVLGFFLNEPIRKKAREVVAPLTTPGVDRIEFRSMTAEGVSVEAVDVPAFDTPEIDAIPLSQYEADMTAAIASVAFTEGNKWRLTDGEHTFYAAIEDKQFLDRINDGVETFRKGDTLRCRMLVVQTERADGLHTEYHVVEVIKHTPRQIQLRIASPGDPSSLPFVSGELEVGDTATGEDSGELGEDRQIGV
jgi:hypothetical protein